MTQFHIWQFRSRPGLGGYLPFDRNFDEVGARADAGIHAPCRDEFGLIARVAPEGAQQHGEILDGDAALVAVANARDDADEDRVGVTMQLTTCGIWWRRRRGQLRSGS